MATETSIADDVIRLLERSRAGDGEAKDALFALLYDDLRRLAAREFQRERRNHTSVPTALVHEVYVRLAELPLAARDRREFMNLAGTVMRRALVDSARRRWRRREEPATGSGASGEMSRDASEPAHHDLQSIRIDRLDGALAALERLDTELAEVVRLRFLAGLPVTEVAELVGVSTPTVKRRWRAARAWLRRSMEEGTS